MKTREFLNTTKEDFLKSEEIRLSKHSSYKSGKRDPKKQAEKYHDQTLRQLNQERWFKIVEQEVDYPTIAWSSNGSLTMVKYSDGNIKFDDEIEGNTNFCRVVGSSARNFKSFFGSIKDVVSAFESNDYSHSKEGQLAPVEFSN